MGSAVRIRHSQLNEQLTLYVLHERSPVLPVTLFSQQRQAKIPQSVRPFVRPSVQQSVTPGRRYAPAVLPARNRMFVTSAGRRSLPQSVKLFAGVAAATTT